MESGQERSKRLFDAQKASYDAAAPRRLELQAICERRKDLVVNVRSLSSQAGKNAEIFPPELHSLVSEAAESESVDLEKFTGRAIAIISQLEDVVITPSSSPIVSV